MVAEVAHGLMDLAEALVIANVVADKNRTAHDGAELAQSSGGLERKYIRSLGDFGYDAERPPP